ncbi:MAG: outer membrane protein [Sphingobacteriales bacterium]
MASLVAICNGINSFWVFDLGYKYPSVLDVSTDTAQFKLVDYATLRGRAGYAIGPFLPYAVVGIAVGRFNYANLDLGTGMFVGKDNAFDSGIIAGLGVDWALTPGIFVRAEWEYIAFLKLNGKTPKPIPGSSASACAFSERIHLQDSSA